MPFSTIAVKLRLVVKN